MATSCDQIKRRSQEGSALGLTGSGGEPDVQGDCSQVVEQMKIDDQAQENQSNGLADSIRKGSNFYY